MNSSRCKKTKLKLILRDYAIGVINNFLNPTHLVLRVDWGNSIAPITEHENSLYSNDRTQ